MFSQTAGNQASQPASSVAGYVFSGLVLSEIDGNSAAAISLLQELAREQEFENRRHQEVRTIQRPWENSSPMRKLPPSEWRSLGGYFDYCQWADRERFMELDKAIASSQRGQMYELETDPEVF